MIKPRPVVSSDQLIIAETVDTWAQLASSLPRETAQWQRGGNNSHISGSRADATRGSLVRVASRAACVPHARLNAPAAALKGLSGPPAAPGAMLPKGPIVRAGGNRRGSRIPGRTVRKVCACCGEEHDISAPPSAPRGIAYCSACGRLMRAIWQFRHRRRRAEIRHGYRHA